MDEFKVCSVCGELKPLSEYYTRRGTTPYYNYCKKCQKNKSKLYPPKHKTIEGNEGEKLVIEELRKHGIYATTGKCSEYKNQDVVAWGCVRIEVKTSQFHERKGSTGGYLFKLGEDPTKFQRTDIVILVCMDTFHIFDADHPIFYREGVLKKGIRYNPYATQRKGREVVLTQELMEEAKDRWDLIEQARQKWMLRLNNEVRV